MATTTSDMEVWFSGSGSDTTGTGTEANPYATYDKAMSVIPDIIDHKVIVKGKEGSYSCTRTWDKRECTRNGIFILEGADLPRTQGPYTVDSVTSLGVSDDCAWDISVSSPGWTTDSLYRGFIKFTSGDCTNCCFPIYSNTSATVRVGGFTNYGVTPAGRDEFVVYTRPSLQLRFETAPTFTWEGHVGRSYSQFIISNVSFQVTSDMNISDGYYYGPYIWDGNGNTLMTLTEFYGPNATWLFAQSAGLINYWEPLEDIFSLMEHPTLLIPDEESWQPMPSIQFVGKETPPTSATPSGDWVNIDGADSVGWPCGIRSFCCRYAINIESCRSTIENAIFSHAEVDHASYCYFSNCVFDSIVGKTYTGLKIDDNSSGIVENCWFDRTGASAITLTDESCLNPLSTSGTTANINGYGVAVGILCRITNTYHNNTLEGTSGKIRLTQNNTTVNWPGSKAYSTDGMGSYVVG